MISWLYGEIIHKELDSCTLNVNGVGYLVALTSRHLDSLTQGDKVEIFIEMHVRENEIRLFGFASQSERSWFNLLTSVQGVGPKVGLAILTTFSLNELSSAIASQDKTMISRANGVGPKMAMRLVTELKDKVPSNLHAFVSANAPSKTQVSEKSKNTDVENSVVAEASSALQNLGYQPADIHGAFSNLSGETILSSDTSTLIRLALKELAKG